MAYIIKNVLLVAGYGLLIFAGACESGDAAFMGAVLLVLTVIYSVGKGKK